MTTESGHACQGGGLRLWPCLPAEEPAEREKVELAAECCREILHHVNQAVRDMEDLLVSPGMAPPGTGHGGDILSPCSEVLPPQGQCLGVIWPLASSSQGYWRSGLDLSLSLGNWPCFAACSPTLESPRGSPCAYLALPLVTSLSLPQRLKDYQRRLDLTHLRQSSDPMLSEFKVNPVAFASPRLTLTLLPRGFLHITQLRMHPGNICPHLPPRCVSMVTLASPPVLGCSACCLPLPLCPLLTLS